MTIFLILLIIVWTILGYMFIINCSPDHEFKNKYKKILFYFLGGPFCWFCLLLFVFIDKYSEKIFDYFISIGEKISSEKRSFKKKIIHWFGN